MVCRKKMKQSWVTANRVDVSSTAIILRVVTTQCFIHVRRTWQGNEWWGFSCWIELVIVLFPAGKAYQHTYHNFIDGKVLLPLQQVTYAAGSTQLTSCHVAFEEKNASDSWQSKRANHPWLNWLPEATSCTYVRSFKPCVPSTYWYHIDTHAFSQLCTSSWQFVCSVSCVSLFYALFM